MKYDSLIVLLLKLKKIKPSHWGDIMEKSVRQCFIQLTEKDKFRIL